VRRLAISQVVDDVSKIGQTLIDHVGLFQEPALGSSLLTTLTTCQIDEVKLAAL